MARRVALVTGGMGGIGEAISTKLHDAGHTVVVTYSPNNANADSWLAKMDANGRQFRAYAVDVADYASCKRCAAQIRSEIGPIDILINNAGITRDASFKKLDKGGWDAVLSTNLDSVFNMTKQWYEDMTTRASSTSRPSSAARAASDKPTTRRRRRACTALPSRLRSNLHARA